jgi:hypothetical protein
MRAQAGDELTVEGRHGVILQVEGADGAPPYLVRWRNGQIGTLYLAHDAEVVSGDHGAGDGHDRAGAEAMRVA